MKYVCGIDIGSSKIAACLGCFRGRRLFRLWWDTTAASGIKQGQIQNVAGLTDCLALLLKNLKAKSGVKVKSAYLGIASQNISTKHSQASIALAERGNKSITKTDIQKVNLQAQILGSCLEEEMLYSQPINYTVDNENEIISPLGLYGHKLQVDLYLICAKVSYINTIIAAINHLGLKVEDITLSGLAASYAVFTPLETTVSHEKDMRSLTGFTPPETTGQQEKSKVPLSGFNSKVLKGLNILCDIGKDITQILIFNDHRLLHYQTIALGGEDLTVALSKELNLDYSLAEEVKISYGHIQNNCQTEDKEIILKKDNNYLTLSQNLVMQILSRQSLHIARAMRDVISPYLLVTSASLSDKVTVYVSGRTACLDGFLELLEVELKMPVMMAKISSRSLLVPLLRHQVLSGELILNYLACFGLLAKAVDLSEKKSAQRPFRRGLPNLLSYIPERIKEIYQEYF